MCNTYRLRTLWIVLRFAWFGVWVGVLMGCSHLPPNSPETFSQAGAATDAAELAELASENWTVQRLPSKRATRFTLTQDAGKRVVHAQAISSASLLRRKLHVAPADLYKVAFSWKVPGLIEAADMALRETEDSAVRVILSFSGDRSNFSAKNRMLSDLTHALTGEELPYATLMYVWCNKRPAGTLITNPRTDRIRKMMVESGPMNLGKWLTYERDIRADFIQAFGEEPGALTGIALMTDTDNTQSKVSAWYGPVQLRATQAAQKAEIEPKPVAHR